MQKGWQWKERDHKEYKPQTYKVASTITEVSEEICQQTLACERCSKNYRIIKPELAFYQQLQLPIPTKCPDCRHQDRNTRKNPRKLWVRNCMKCNKNLETTYSPKKLEMVYCEECYLRST